MGVSKVSTQNLKRKILKLLEEDEEFRYLVASKIGMLEILKKLNEHDKKFNEILAEIRDLKNKSVEHDKKFVEIMAEIKGIKEKMAEHDKKFVEVLDRLAEHDKKFEDLKRDILELKRFQQKMSITTEEEAIEVVRYLLRVNYGLTVELETKWFNSSVEVDIYGIIGDICVFGEAAVRLGLSKVKDLLNKFNYVKKYYPEALRDRIILVLYGIRVMPEVINEAKKHKIWVVTATKELTKMEIIENKGK